MILKAFISSLFAGLLELDNVQAGQFLVSRPAFAGPLLGWLNGCPVEGARMGILIELIYLDFIPVGGVVPPNGLVAAAAAVLALAWAGLPESTAFFFGIMAGFLYGKVEYRLRVSRSSWIKGIETDARNGAILLERNLAGSLLAESAVSGLYIFLFSGLAAVLAAPLLRAEPGTLFRVSDLAYSLMPWLGLSGLYFRFRTQVYKNK